MQHNIDFGKQEKVAAREYKQNANIVTLRLKKREKQITNQIRVLVTVIKRLKICAAEEGRTMSSLASELIAKGLDQKKPS